ncbi:MAG TPA: host attachment family protein [Pseudolabrys sp.]|jgi:protein required for attachment to host cells|nr:host attachment family protein [Pseudolabrys sp.]
MAAKSLSIRHKEWVVVCDGAKALVLENIGDATMPDLKTREVYEQENAATRELGTDSPGRAAGVDGKNRSAVGQTDWHERNEQAFLENLAKRLDAKVSSGVIKSIVLIAPPRALGVLRSAYSPALKGAVRAEIDKDLVAVPVHEIEKRLTAA